MTVYERPKHPCPDCGKLISMRAKHCVECGHRYSGLAQRLQLTNPIERFWSHVDKSSGTDACWPWTAGRTRKGNYGKFSLKHNHTVIASHFIYEHIHGPIPDGLLVCHSCDNPPCCNPSHLFLGTHQENTLDASAKGRLATGARNGMNTHPESRLTGDRSSSRLHPERLARGDKSGARLHPERMSRGESHHAAKLTNDLVREIRTQYASGIANSPQLARQYGVRHQTIYSIIHRKTWKHVV